MSEPAKVRLVRCPKCENLLPELADYSVYQCGGCGAVLRAKHKNVEADTLSLKSDQEGGQGLAEKFCEKSVNCSSSDKGVKVGDGCENDVKSNGSSSRRAGIWDFSSNKSEKIKNSSVVGADEQIVENIPDLNENQDGSDHAEIGKEYEESNPANEVVNASRKMRHSCDWNVDEEETEMLRRNPRMDVEGTRYLTSNYSEEGPSNYQTRSGYGYGDPPKNWQKADEFNKVEYLQQDRAELLRKLDELKDQLSRSCEVNEKPKEKVPFGRRLGCLEDPYGGAETWIPDGCLGSNRVPMQYPMPNSHLKRPSYASHYPDPAPYMNRHEMGMHRFYPSGQASNNVERFGDPLRSRMHGRDPYQAPGPFHQQPSHPHFTGQYIGNDMEPFEPFPHNRNIHRISHCYGKAPVHPNAFCNKTFTDALSKPMFYHNENPLAFGPCDYNPKIGDPSSLSSHIPQSHTRWPSTLSTKAGGFVHRRPPKVVLAATRARCLPTYGGAPFVTCYNCFELLQVPKKILFVDNNQKKMRCGACSTVLLLRVVNKKLLVSVHVETKSTPNVVDNGPRVTVNDGTSHSHGHANRAGMNFSSDDYDNSGYDFQSMDREVNSSSTGRGVGSSKSAEMRSLQSGSPYSSEDDGSPDSSNGPRKESNSAELPGKTELSPPQAGSPLKDHFDYSNKYHVVNRFGKGNQSGRSECEEGLPKKVASRQNSIKDASLVTEMDVSYNEYSNTGTSQESADTRREEDQRRNHKVNPSFFAGIIKRSLRDFSRSSHTSDQGSINVTVNGHPILDRLVRKVEKLAGPIQPGSYWYDFRAGFWGLMDGPCLGIIPPFIEEFNHPMPESCAGGNTGVFVNGRELHPKDLELLCSRGLPRARDRSYIIEISGRVLDEESGEELDGLGKLAPTVERAKHGFGMKPPRMAV